MIFNILNLFTGLASCAFSIFQKMSKCSLGLINDEKILALLMQNIRGGLSFIGERLQENCPLHNPDWQSLYADANNLVI